MKVSIETETKHHVTCPNCNNHRWSVGHMLHRKKSWEWSCDECYSQFDFNCVDDGIELTQVPTTSISGAALVKYCGNTIQDQLFFIVEVYFSFDKEGKLDPDWEDNKRYYIQQHTCPTNLISCQAIIHNGDTDPHGVVQYVRSAPYPVICQHYGITQKELLDSNNQYLYHYFHECGAGVTDEEVGLDVGRVFDVEAKAYGQLFLPRPN